MIHHLVKNRIAISIVITIVLIVGWYFGWYQAQLEREARLVAEHESLEQKLTTADVQLDQAREITSRLANAEKKWQLLKSSLVGPEDAEILVERISSLAREDNLRVLNTNLSFDPLLLKLTNDEQSSPIERVLLRIEGKGRFFDIGEFIRSLEEDVLVADINNLELTYQQAAQPDIYFAADIEVFMLPENNLELAL